MASWECMICHETGNDFGSFVKHSSKKIHLACYRDQLAQEAVKKYVWDLVEEKALRERAEEDQARAKEEAQLKELLEIRARGDKLWTREDRKKLAEAKLICVHCGVPIGPQAKEARSGPEQKHCRKCYYAREYGEDQASAAAAKSQAGIDEVTSVLSGQGIPVPPATQEPKKSEVKDEQAKDRFSLLDLD